MGKKVKTNRCRTCDHCYLHHYSKKLYCEVTPSSSAKTSHGDAKVSGNDEACEKYMPKTK